jgi:uncharacterized protein (TIGR03083 family)
MRLTPRYDGEPIIDVDAVMPEPYAGVVRQRDRFAHALGALDASQWEAPSRCEGWSVHDVVLHLEGVNRFWTLSIDAGRRGEPTRFLATFDPVAVPAQLVAAARGAEPEGTLAAFVESNAELARALGALDDAGWSLPAEAPPGHLAMRALAMHALWDSWVHERDVLLPLGLGQPREDDEILACLAYAVALGPALRLSTGEVRAATLHVVVHDPEIELTAVVGPSVKVVPGRVGTATATIEGDAVDVVEALSVRAPAVAIAEEHRWLVDGLDVAFDGREPAA